MTLPTLVILVALILALAEEWRDHGQSLVGWAVVLLCVASVWGRL